MIDFSNCAEKEEFARRLLYFRNYDIVLESRNTGRVREFLLQHGKDEPMLFHSAKLNDFEMKILMHLNTLQRYALKDYWTESRKFLVGLDMNPYPTIKGSVDPASVT